MGYVGLMLFRLELGPLMMAGPRFETETMAGQVREINMGIYEFKQMCTSDSLLVLA